MNSTHDDYPGVPSQECQQQMIQILGSFIFGILFMISEVMSLTKRVKGNGIIHSILCRYEDDDQRNNEEEQPLTSDSALLNGIGFADTIVIPSEIITRK